MGRVGEEPGVERCVWVAAGAPAGGRSGSRRTPVHGFVGDVASAALVARGPFRAAAALALALALAAGGCRDADRAPRPADHEHPAAGTDTAGAGTGSRPAAPATTTVSVYFTRDEAPVPVSRQVPADDRIRGALEQLLQGPTPEEQAAGIFSFFSSETTGMLRSVALDERGRATIDFADFRDVIPNASSSAGSAILLAELHATLFQFPDVREVDYRIDGSCELFWNFLQRDCGIVTRDAPSGEPAGRRRPRATGRRPGREQ